MRIIEKFQEAQALNPHITVDEFCSTLPQADLGNAQRLQVRYWDRLRYSIADENWVVFNGKAWLRNSRLLAGSILEEATLAIAGEKDYLQSLRADLLDADEAKKQAKQHVDFLKFINRSMSKNAMHAALDLAQPGLMIEEEEFDQHDHLINTQSGTVDLRTGEHKPHSPDDKMTGITFKSFVEFAKAYRWRQFITDFCRDAEGNADPAKEEYLQAALGYSLYAANRKHYIFCLTGDERNEARNGGNGKSTLFEVLEGVLGKSYLKRFQPPMLVRNKNGNAPEDRHRLPLVGTRIAIASEFDRDCVLDAEVVKKLSGEPTFDARNLHNDPFSAKTTATMWLMLQVMPKVSANDRAVRRRLRRIRLLNVFWDGTGEAPVGHYQMVDENLATNIIKEEGDGVLAWLIEGAIKYAQDGLPDYADATESLNDMWSDGDPVGDFLKTCVVRDPECRVFTGDLYSAYSHYVSANGLDLVSANKFGRDVTAKRIPTEKIGGVVYRMGARLNVIGQAYAEGNDPRCALDFVAKIGTASITTPSVCDESAVFAAPSTPAAPTAVLIRGAEMSDEMLNCVPATPVVGDVFKGPIGERMEIVKEAIPVAMDAANVVPFKRTARR